MNYPAIKTVLSFVLGILVSEVSGLSADIFFIIAVILIITAVMLYIFDKIKWLALNFILIFVSAGGVSASIEKTNLPEYPFTESYIKNAIITGEIKSIKLAGEKRLTLDIKVDSLDLTKIHPNMVFRVNVYTEIGKADSLGREFKPGGLIKFKGNIRKPWGIRNPYEFDYQKYLKIQGIAATVSTGQEKIIAYSNFNNTGIFTDIKAYMYKVRLILDDIFRKHCSIEAASFFRGIILADRSEISPETRDDFINTGTVHILAVSGLHTGMIILILSLVFSRLGYRIKYILIIICLVFYVILTGAPASVVRASIMAISIYLSYFLGRKPEIYNSLAVAALLILAVSPQQLFSPGFQLSFTAVTGIVFFYKPFDNKIRVIKNGLLKTLTSVAVITLAVQIATFPLTAYYFGKISWLSVPANIFVIPFAGFILALGIVILLTAPLLPVLAEAYANAADLSVEILYYIVKTISQSDLSFSHINLFSLFNVIFSFLLITAGFVLFIKSKSLYFRLIIIVFVPLNIWFFSFLDDENLITEGVLTLISVDVGQGDCFLISFPGGETGLIDAGSASVDFDNGERVIIPLLRNIGIDKIDYGFISHFDNDHYGGFLSLIEAGMVEKVIFPNHYESSVFAEAFKLFCEKYETKTEFFKDTSFNIGGAKIFVLSREEDMAKSSSLNEGSGIIKINYGNRSFLFTGDAGEEKEQELIRRYEKFLRSDVLKVSHHGSKSGTSKKFLDFVNPEFAIISCGLGNVHKHPSKDVVERLENKKCKILRTDINGAVILETDGVSIIQKQWR